MISHSQIYRARASPVLVKEDVRFLQATCSKFRCA